jgi:hypothetical protein
MRQEVRRLLLIPFLFFLHLVFAAATQTRSTDDDLGARRVLVRPRESGNQLVPPRADTSIYLGDEQRDEAG